MKKAIGRFLLSPNFQSSMLSGPARSLIRASRDQLGFSTDFMVQSQAIERPHYAYCMLGAARLAKDLGQDRISAIEFGVAGGNGLVFMDQFAKEVEAETGVKVECYGFDTGEGMPPPEGAADLPYWFEAAQYKMDREELEKKIGNAKIIYGNVKDTIGTFLKDYDPAPIGAVFNDTDYFSSTRDSLRLFDEIAASPDKFLPRMFLYFDDIRGSEYEMYGSFNGQLLAIEEYNAGNDDVKIHLNQNLIPSTHIPWRYHIYYAHAFNHPEYATRVGHARQAAIHKALKLKNG